MKTRLNHITLLALFAASTLVNAQDGNKEDFVPTGKGWRMIQGSEQGNVPLAFAWGVKSDAKDAIKKEEDGSAYTELDERTNYIVNLESGEILGKTEGQHGCDLDHENGRSTHHRAVWSERGDYAVQIEMGDKMNGIAAWVYHVDDDLTKASKGAEVLDTAGKAVEAKLKAAGMLKKTPWEDYITHLHDVHVVRRGSGSVLIVGLDGDGIDGSSFDSTVTFKLSPSKDGAAPKLVLQGVEMHK